MWKPVAHGYQCTLVDTVGQWIVLNRCNIGKKRAVWNGSGFQCGGEGWT